MALRSSTELQLVPPERDPAAANPALPLLPGAVPPPVAPITLASLTRYETALPAAVALPRRMVATPPPELTWALASMALAAGVGWICERRRRVQLEGDSEGAPWPTVPASRRRVPTAGVDETFPEDGEIAEAARPVYVSVIGDTPSRREATLVDLHDLNGKLRNVQRNHKAATELLEQHLVDFRYTSPWVFLELRELYKQLGQRDEWEMVRDAFRNRFGQNAPQWDAASTAGDEIADDKQLCADLLRKWPQREARLFMLRWMLGDASSRQKSSGPPQLPLGVYRDMLLLDAILDEVMTAKPASPPVLAKQA
jgi:hypothetical protein